MTMRTCPGCGSFFGIAERHTCPGYTFSGPVFPTLSLVSPPDDYDLSIHSNPDASAWARLFKETCDKLGRECDEEWMLGWFANAMMAMRDSIDKERRALKSPLERT